MGSGFFFVGHHLSIYLSISDYSHLSIYLSINLSFLISYVCYTFMYFYNFVTFFLITFFSKVHELKSFFSSFKFSFSYFN